MDIPERLAEKIAKDSALYGAILQSLAEFKPWFDQSKTPFFPEYTDHNWSHVTQTMATASSLIRDEAWPVVTPADAATLVLAVLLHDCGMHLTEDGFVALIGDVSHGRRLDGWTEKSWPELWAEFLGDASRFDARKLYALFGDTEPIHRPDLDPKHWTSQDKLLIGDFLRRHHARLAHEIALHGVPGPGMPPLQLRGLAPDLSDLAGLVARSHGLPIRSCLRHLARYDVREYKGTHAVFLMSVLRVADYLQVHAERAPEQTLKVRNLRSPLSQREWKTHAAIRDIRNTHEDPEAIFIDAAPKDVATFLRLKRLLAGIQEELDASWAVLGEVYGRYPPLSELGLKLRRVLSNVDDDEEFAKTVSYLPYEAAFDAAGPDLLKLLIRPLYGEHPEIGIRELLQNAVDACRELKDYLDQSSELLAIDLTPQNADVEIRLEDKDKEGRWLEVSDQGIGMSAETVRSYFLRAGASFRRSDAWRKIHETPEGKSRVLRSGRFGIGVLAAFLLGDEVEVSTRNAAVGAGGGITFKATLDTEEIELTQCSRPVCTIIRVRISDESVWKSLSETPTGWNQKTRKQTVGGTWDWYCLAEPRVARSIRSAQPAEGLLQEFSLPGPGSRLGPKWRRIRHDGYADIQWSYWEGPFLACNGILVMKSDPSPHYRSILGNIASCEIMWPHVSVFDPDGHLPLVLQRNSLATDKYPFHEQLFRDVIRDFLAYLLVRGPSFNFSVRAEGYGDRYPGVTFSSQQYRPSAHFCSAPEGLYPADEWLIKQGDFHKFLLVGGLAPFGKTEPQIPTEKTGRTLLVPVPNPFGTQRYREWIRFALCGAKYNEFGYLRDFAVVCRRMLLSKSEYDFIRKGNLISKYWWSAVREESSNKEWVALRTGDCDCGDTFDLLEFANSIEQRTPWPVLIEWHLARHQPEPEALTPLAALWRDLLKSPVIPYDPAERRKNLPEAFAHLEDYIKAHEQLAAEEEEEKEKKEKKENDEPSLGESGDDDPI